MEDRRILNENDLQSVNGGVTLTDTQWQNFANKVAALAQNGMLSESDRSGLELIIAKKDNATLLPLLVKKQALGGAWAELMQVFLKF